MKSGSQKHHGQQLYTADKDFREVQLNTNFRLATMVEQCEYWGHGSSGSAFGTQYQILQSTVGYAEKVFQFMGRENSITNFRSIGPPCKDHHYTPFHIVPTASSVQAAVHVGKGLHTQFQCKLAGSNVEGKQRSLRSVLPARRLLVLIYLNDGGLCIRTEPTEFCVSHSCGPKWLMCV